MRRPRLALTAVALACAALVAAGCSEKESGIGAGQEPVAKRPAKKPSTGSSPAAVQAGAVAKATGNPKIVSPKGSPPTKLQTRDLKKGTGAVAKTGDQVQVNYALALYGSGKPIDNSFDRGQPLPLQLGAGGAIPGFVRGVTGMRVGGRRQVIVPPALGYGTQQVPNIPANSTLIFVIDLLKAAPGAQGGGAPAP